MTPIGCLPSPGSRRALLAAALGVALSGGRVTTARSHGAVGRVEPPQPLPSLRGVSTDGQTVDLARLLPGKISAVQLMFTGCSATCPIQGSVFAEVQRQLASSPPHLQLLSVSIDPLGDDAKALRAWLRRYDARPARWTAAVVAPDHLDRLLDFLRGRARGADRHTPQVYLFDRLGRLVFRTLDLPPAEAVVGLMRDIDRDG